MPSPRVIAVKPNPIVLLIDDDKANRRLLRMVLKSRHYRLIETANGALGLAASAAYQPDVVILELALPDMRGLTVLKRLRQSGQVPVLVLSDCHREEDTVAALDAGASDFLAKPFSEAELLARLRVLQRCFPGQPEDPVVLEGGLKVDLTRHLVTLSGSKIDLTATEEAVCHALAAYAGKVVPSRHLLRSVWGANRNNQTHCLRVNISSLRKKLESTRGRVAIETADGLGYRLWLRSGDRVHEEDMFPHETTELQIGES